MARINIENSIFNDHRFIRLFQIEGDFYKALGILVGAWMLAQKHYLNEEKDRLIPLKEWDNSLFKNIEIVGLAERRDKGIYLKGSSEQFKWLIQRSNAGKNSAQRVKTPNDRPTTVLARTTVEQPLTLTPTHTLTNSLSENNNLCTLAQNSASRQQHSKNTFSIKDFREFETCLPDLIKTNLVNLYPSPEFLRREFMKMHSWLIANPKKNLKTTRGWAQFVGNWLEKSWPKYQASIPSLKSSEETLAKTEISNRIADLFAEDV